jgi:hypothetical protein
MTFQNKRLTGILIAVPALLLIPFIGMQFSNEVSWSMIDFLVAGVLLLGAGLLVELVLRKIKKRQPRIVLCMAIFIGLFLIWAELAVGLFGTPLAGS